MTEADKYYPYYEKLVQAAPEKEIRDTPEYQALSAHFPHISEHILLKKTLQKVNFELRSSRDRSTRLVAEKEKRKLVRRLQQKDTLMRICGEKKILSRYDTRLLTANIRKRFSSQVSKVRRRALTFLARLQERSRRARYARAYSLPPSLLDIRSLDPVDRSLALKDWIGKRRTRV